MREIKFRVWFDGKYIHNDCHIIGEAVLLGDWLHVVPIERLNDVVVEQFTGIQDKNGNDIYEGDIMARPDRDFVWVVEYIPHRGSYQFVHEDVYVRAVSANVMDLLEVVGNIHENQELLK